MKIDKGIPLQPLKKRPKYPWAGMKIGDSMLFTELPSTSVCPQVTKAARNTGFKFKTRTTPDGVRVWRVA